LLRCQLWLRKSTRGGIGRGNWAFKRPKLGRYLCVPIFIIGNQAKGEGRGGEWRGENPHQIFGAYKPYL